jgi:hypothetical protein
MKSAAELTTVDQRTKREQKEEKQTGLLFSSRFSYQGYLVEEPVSLLRSQLISASHRQAEAHPSLAAKWRKIMNFYHLRHRLCESVGKNVFKMSSVVGKVYCRKRNNLF